jgi:hypothetical protein
LQSHSTEGSNEESFENKGIKPIDSYFKKINKEDSKNEANVEEVSKKGSKELEASKNESIEEITSKKRDENEEYPAKFDYEDGYIPMEDKDKGKVEEDTSPIVALPPWSKVDKSVLDALPLPLKREIERAYEVRPLATSNKKRKTTKTTKVPKVIIIIMR